MNRFVLEPHAAVLAAGLPAQLARQLDYRSLTAGGGYLTGEHPAQHPLATTFEVLETSPLPAQTNPGRDAASIRSAGWRSRHAVSPLDPAQLRAALSTSVATSLPCCW